MDLILEVQSKFPWKLINLSVTFLELSSLNNVGAYSLLGDRKPAIVLDYSNVVVMNPSSELCGESYNIMTYGISSSNEWHASSILPNSQGGNNYILCHRGHNVSKQCHH